VSADLPLAGDELAAIKTRAEAATPGPWEYDHIDGTLGEWGGEHDGRRILADVYLDRDGGHIAGMDPATTLRLVAEVERLRHALDVIAGEDLDYRGRLRLTDAENAIYVIARDALGRKA
jgi:hypothetical protein